MLQYTSRDLLSFPSTLLSSDDKKEERHNALLHTPNHIQVDKERDVKAAATTTKFLFKAH
jgi:hypothetical protein